MTTKKKFYVTTAIDYPNAEPHIGHAYQKIIADVLARWHSLLGEDVFFLTGTDEHGKKIQEAAEKANKTSKQFVDELAIKFKEAWKSLNLKYNRFIRTTDKDHEKLVQEVIKKCDKNKDIYKSEYEGLYCVGCEAYYTEKDVVDGKCPLHNRPLEKIKEESYFFRLSRYQKFLLELYKDKEFILPDERRNEIISRVKEGLKDLSISRTSFKWGIPFPLDKKHIVYVWFDALFNYLSGSGIKHKYWPADLHLLGKDNSWFHCVYWPAFLKSAGYKMPKTVFVHGFLTFNGQKISKSLGNVISPKLLVDKYSCDSVRYFVCRNFVLGQDGDFDENLLVTRHNSELADKLGNLVSRVSALAEKYGLQATENKLFKKLKLKEIEKNIENYELDKALNLIFEFVDACNLYVQENELWKSGDKKKLYELADSIKAISILLWSFIPETCEKISRIFNFKIDYKEIKKPLKVSMVKKADILFKKIDTDKESKINKPEKSEKLEGIATMADIVEYKDWEKLELRVGKIIKVEDIEGADKLYKLEIDLGKEKRIVCAGLKKFYSKDELKNKRCILFVNLAPRVMRGIESKGMILAAVSEDESQVKLIQPDSDIALGSRVR